MNKVPFKISSANIYEKYKENLETPDLTKEEIDKMRKNI